MGRRLSINKLSALRPDLKNMYVARTFEEFEEIDEQNDAIHDF